jgi:hypothetical protein
MDPEPLPEGHLRWKTPNLLLMQHVAGSTPKFMVRTMQFATDQVDRYIKGESLQNVVTGEYCPPLTIFSASAFECSSLGASEPFGKVQPTRTAIRPKPNLGACTCCEVQHSLRGAK